MSDDEDDVCLHKGVRVPNGPYLTVLDPSFGQDPSAGHFKFLTHFWLNYYQIRYVMSYTTP